MLACEEVWPRTERAAAPRGSEGLARAAALGRVLARPLVATPALPAADVSALDGFPEALIQMYINSPGGQVYAGMAIYDTMPVIPNPISTLAVRMTASFGTVLLTAGTKGHRFALPNATIHMHQPLGEAQGQASDIEIHRVKSCVSRIN